jgi:hypothetical protein
MTDPRTVDSRDTGGLLSESMCAPALVAGIDALMIKALDPERGGSQC